MIYQICNFFQLFLYSISVYFFLRKYQFITLIIHYKSIIQTQRSNIIKKMISEMQQKKNIYQCHQILSQDQLFPSSKSLMLGNVGSLKPEVIQVFKPQAVLTVMDEYMYKQFNIPSKLKNNGIHVQDDHLWITLEDDDEADIFVHFQKAHEFINNHIGKMNVLVHCQAGVSRSATIVISYIMKMKSLNLQQANKFVVQRRYQVSPNQGFWAALQKYQEFLLMGQEKQGGLVVDPISEFTNENYKTKFCNHIISFKNPSTLNSHNLFLGQATVVRSNYLELLKIKSVLSILTEHEYKPLKIKPLCEHMNVEHKFVQIDDGPQEDISQYFGECIQFIDKGISQGNVLIHCKVGKSRSASIVIAYLMHRFPEISFEATLKFVQQKRAVVNPNQGFQKQIKDYYMKKEQ